MFAVIDSACARLGRRRSDQRWPLIVNGGVVVEALDETSTPWPLKSPGPLRNIRNAGGKEGSEEWGEGERLKGSKLLRGVSAADHIDSSKAKQESWISGDTVIR